MIQDSHQKNEWRSTLRLFALPLVILLIIPLIARLWQVPREQARRETCQLNLRQIGLAMQLYTQDNNGYLPGASQGKAWVTSVSEMARNFSIFRCPDDKSLRGGKGNAQKISYWMNENVQATSMASFAQSSRTLLVGEGNDGKDKNSLGYNRSSLPSAWSSDQDSPAYRHLGGANYLMADGTVHWLKPNEVMTFGGRKNAFAAR